MKNLPGVVFLVFLSLALLISCEKGEDIQPREAELNTENLSTDGLVDKGDALSKAVFKIYFSSEPLTVTFVEFDFIINRIIDEGFSIAEDCQYLGSEVTRYHGEWGNRVGASIVIDAMDHDNEVVTFHLENLMFAGFTCGFGSNSPYCYYLGQQADTPLNIFAGPDEVGCLLGNVIITSPDSHATIDLAPLKLPLEGLACRLMCY